MKRIIFELLGVKVFLYVKSLIFKDVFFGYGFIYDRTLTVRVVKFFDKHLRCAVGLDEIVVFFQKL